MSLVSLSPMLELVREDDFTEADRMVPELGDPPGKFVTLEELVALAS